MAQVVFAVVAVLVAFVLFRLLRAGRIREKYAALWIVIGFGVILFTIIITAIYVKRANGEFDDLNDAVAKAVLK